MTEEPDWKHLVAMIGLVIEDTIPDPSSINTLDAVRLLVREVNCLRKAVGLQSYRDLAREEERHG